MIEAASRDCFHSELTGQGQYVCVNEQATKKVVYVGTCAKSSKAWKDYQDYVSSPHHCILSFGLCRKDGLSQASPSLIFFLINIFFHLCCCHLSLVPQLSAFIEVYITQVPDTEVQLRQVSLVHSMDQDVDKDGTKIWVSKELVAWWYVRVHKAQAI